jgi:hypothetical protein
MRGYLIEEKPRGRGHIRCKLNPMLSHKTAQRSKTLVVSPEGLLRLVNALPVNHDKLRFTVECSDGTTLYPSNIKELIEFPNPKNREILEIEIGSYADSPDCRIKFSSDILGPVFYTVSGEDSYVVSTADIIDQHLESMTGDGPHFIANSYLLRDFAGPILLSPAVFLILAGFVLCWIIVVQQRHLYLGSFKFGGFTSAMILTLGLIALPIAIKFEHLHRYFFPRVSFCIGGGIARYKRMIEKRKLFGLATLVALAIGILGSWLANMLPII